MGCVLVARQNFTFSPEWCYNPGLKTLLSSLSPSKEDMPKKKDRYADEAEYAPSGVHFLPSEAISNKRSELDRLQLFSEDDILITHRGGASNSDMPHPPPLEERVLDRHLQEPPSNSLEQMS